jgi:prepilin-type N-terminal cleavage/methylation domain-containing protein
MRRVSRPPDDEDGFTLIELLLSISITLIILSAVSAALLTFLSNGPYTSRRDDHSAGAILAATYLNRDLANAQVFTAGTTPSSCGASAVTLFTLQWRDFTATSSDPTPRQNGTAYTVKYQVEVDPDAVPRVPPCRLRRLYTSGLSYSGTQTVLSNVVLVPQVQPAALTITTSSDCSSGLNVQLLKYDQDLNANYHLLGCLGTRLL